jgi:DNA helicase TIP49 (TBP-interacting protein)
MAQETSLRYALNLISAAQVVAKKRKGPSTGETMFPLPKAYHSLVL